jgi:carbonic anhydrase
MKKLVILLGLAMSSLSLHAAEGAHWGYTGETAPENWAKLSPEFASCSGKNQSPIDLQGFIHAELKPLKFNYQSGAKSIVNNGHTVQVNYAPGSTLTVEGDEFELKQFHFHAPSENLIKGKSYPLEGHFVHADKNGNLLVLAVMFVKGKENKALAQAWAQMPHQAGGPRDSEGRISAADLLPANHGYYRFNGSLTTPPCSEGVRWLVMKHPVTASAEQIEAFEHVMHHPNNRPVQPVNARTVLE